MATATKTTGHHIINGHEILLEPGEQVSYRDDATVQTFGTKTAAEAQYKIQYPAEWARNRAALISEN
jgi:hypothetical protein